MKANLLKMAAVAFLFTACTSNTTETETYQTEVTSQEEHHHREGELSAIELNNGEEWQVNPEMMVHVQQMKKDVETFSSTNDTAYSALTKKLKANIQLLTSSCTMEGQAHDELHKWLLPFIGLVNDFTTEKDAMVLSEKFQEIKKSMEEFDLYFK
jgi:hypothetical protein